MVGFWWNLRNALRRNTFLILGVILLISGILYYTNPLPKATSEETSSGTDQYVVDNRDGATAAEDVPAVEKNVNNESAATAVPKEESPVDGLTNELLDNLKIKVCFNLKSSCYGI